MNTYILSYNPLEMKISHGQLAIFIKDSKKIFQHYPPFRGTYVIKSFETLQSLAESFREVFEGAPFIVTMAYPTAMGGAQPEMVWSWVNGHGFGNENQSTLPALNG